MYDYWVDPAKTYFCIQGTHNFQKHIHHRDLLHKAIYIQTFFQFLERIDKQKKNTD